MKHLKTFAFGIAVIGLAFGFSGVASCGLISSPSFGVKAAEGDSHSTPFASKTMPTGWTASYAANAVDTNNRGVQWLRSGQTGLSLTFSPSPTYAIKKISITCATNGAASSNTLSATVGGASFGSSVAQNNTGTTTYDFTVSSAMTGIVVVSASWAQGQKNSFYVSNITLVEGSTNPSITITGIDSILVPNTATYTSDAPSTIWSLENASPIGCATLDGATVTAVKSGTIDLVATASGYAKTVKTLTIKEAALSIDPSSLTLSVGGAEAMLEAKYSEFTPTIFTWSLTDVSPAGCVSIVEQADELVTILPGSVAGSAVLNVSASDGTRSKSATSVLSVVTPSSEYTLTSKTTTYTPLTTSALFKSKVNGVDDLTIGDTITNIRVGASPNTAAIMLGNKTEGGAFTLTLPVGQIATEITLTALANSDSQTSTMKIQNETKTTTNAGNYVFTPFTNSVLFTMTNRTWASKIVIKAVNSAADAAVTYGKQFLDETASECLSLSVTAATWSHLSAIYSGADSNVQNSIKNGAPAETGTDLNKALLRYDYIMTKYGTAAFSEGNFMNRTIPTKGSFMFSSTSNASSSIETFVVILAAAGLIITAGYFIRRKQH